MTLIEFLAALDAQIAKGRRMPFGEDDDAVIWELWADDVRITLTLGALRMAVQDIRFLLETAPEPVRKIFPRKPA